MVGGYRILYKGGPGKLVEKKSCSITDLRPTVPEKKVPEYIEEIRKKYWDVRHHRFAYIVGDRGQSARCSDDGEPSQAAGRPVTDVLVGEEFHDVCVAVTRYFGDILLSMGGLVRAYSDAVREGTKNCVILEKKLAIRLNITTDHNGAGKVQYTAAQGGIDTLDTRYMDEVVSIFPAPIAEERRSTVQITEEVAGRAATQRVNEVYYGLGGSGLVMF